MGLGHRILKHCTVSALISPIVLPAAMGLLLVAVFDSSQTVHESPAALFIFNGLFLSAIPIWLSVLSARAYRTTGRIQMLLSACALLMAGAGAFAAGVAAERSGGINATVTIHNLSMLGSAALHLAAALALRIPRRRMSNASTVNVAVALGGTLGLVGLMAGLALHDVLSVFVLPGQALAPIRVSVLTLSVAFLTTAAFMFGAESRRRRSSMMRTYSMGVAFLAIGLLVVLLSVPGSYPSWFGRFAQGAGNLYFLANILMAIREGKRKGARAETILSDVFGPDDEEQVGRILNSSLSGTYIFELQSRKYIYINPSFTRMTGYTFEQLDAMDRSAVLELFHPEHRAALRAHWERMLQVRDAGTTAVEYPLRTAEGRWIWCLAWDGVFRRLADGTPAEIIGSFLDITERKQSEAALAEARMSLERERNLLHAVMDGARNSHLVYLDPDFNYLRVNGTYARTCGYAPEEMIGKNHFALYPHAENEAIFKRVRDTGVPAEFQDRPFVFPDQPERGVTYWNWTPTPDRDERGQTVGLVFALYETTTRKRAEEELRKSERRWAVTLASIGDAVIATDASGRVTFLNALAEALTGWRLADAAGRPVQEVFRIVNEATRAAVDDPIRKVLETGMVVGLANHTVLLRQGGGEVPIDDSGAPIRDETGRVTGVVLVFRDITERSRAENALRASEHRSRLLSETAAQLLASEDPQRVVESLALKVMEHLDCQFFFNFLVHDKSERLKLNACAGIPPETAASIEYLDYGAAVCGCVARDRERIIAHDILTTPDPRTDLIRSFGVQAYCCHPLFSEGNLIGTLSFGTRTRPRFTSEEVDLMRTVADQVAIAMQRVQVRNALQHSREALARANQDLERQVQARTANLTAANCELEARARQLRLLTGELSMAEQRERKRLGQILHDGLQQHLAAVKLQVGSLSGSLNGDGVGGLAQVEHLLGEAIQMSRSLSAELSPPVLHERGLGPALEWLARSMQERYAFKVHCTIRHQPELAEDVNVLLFQSVRELLFNSAKHSGGSSAELTLEVRGGELRISVNDSGVGFDPRTIGGIGDTAGGIGLFGIRERLGLLGGGLELDSAPGEGSRFTLRLPYSEPGRAERSVAGQPASSAVVRVLLADDHALFRHGLARLCKREPDIKVVGQAESGREAIDLARDLRPDVILMDINMPEMNGIEATAAIHTSRPEIAIIGLSMYEDALSIQAMRQAGAVDCKSKSCSAAELIASIRACTPERTGSTAAERHLRPFNL